MNIDTINIGANYDNNGNCSFTVWAPLIKTIKLNLISESRIIEMQQDEKGYWNVKLNNIAPDTQYMYLIADEKIRPDMASYFQPEGVHKPSSVVNHNEFKWQDNCFKPIDIKEMIIYELHIGTFTKEGTFYSALERLEDLKEIGINCIEIMPIAQFPGKRNWGYDGVYLYSVQNSYGGPTGLKTFVNECHRQGISVILDAVYNHLGPEGNYLWDYGPYFTSKYKTPWGDALNFDGPHSDGVRNFIVNNALHWLRNYHIDGLRLDAVHAIFDMSAKHILREIAQQVKNYSAKTGKNHILIAESDLNDTRIIKPAELGGYGIDAQWCDDFHHCIHTLLTNEQDGYYIDFGKTSQLAKSYNEGYVYSGQYSKTRKRQFGITSKEIAAEQLVVFTQNHDQIGNRMLGQRLSNLVSFDALKLAAGLLLFSPYVPLIFMGEEYAEDAPFLFFIDHSDKTLIKAVQEGRKREFKNFSWKGAPPDPYNENTFKQCILNWHNKNKGQNEIIRNLYKKIIAMRKTHPCLSTIDKNTCAAVSFEEKKTLLLQRWKDNDHITCFFNLSKETSELKDIPNLPIGKWANILDSQGKLWGGSSFYQTTFQTGREVTIQPLSFSIYKKLSSD
ncbi:malto-oligosyltrehalose trehalohydrolase [Candidatus Magnetoovum chiemensis]|nr:malto-oligosyltrehalose trehalohydrolase [Candidatus Magnetoovum chiemensis]